MDEWGTDHTPSALRVSGSGADSGLITLSDIDADIDYYFFDVSGAAADQFVVSGVARTSNAVTLGGMAFDTPEPSSLVLLMSLLLPGGYLVRRLRERE